MEAMWKEKNVALSYMPTVFLYTKKIKNPKACVRTADFRAKFWNLALLNTERTLDLSAMMC